MATEFLYLVLNVNGLNSDDNTKFCKFIDKFKKSKYHALFIQEPRYKNDKKQSRNNWENACKFRGIKCLISANDSGSRGVASFWKQAFLDQHSQVDIQQIIPDTAQLSTITIAGMEINICNLYAPNNGADRSAVFTELKDTLPPYCIIVGDFNLVMDTNRDVWQHQSTQSDYDNSGWGACQAMARHLGLHDGWRHQEGQDASPFYTHKSYHSNLLTTASRIDFILAPNHPQALLNSPCPRCHISFKFGHDPPYWAGKGQADHTATTMAIKWQQEDKPPPRPRINPIIYSLKEWLDVQDVIWNNHLTKNSQNGADPTQFWVTWKETLVTNSLSFSKKLAKRKRDDNDQLEETMRWHTDL